MRLVATKTNRRRTAAAYYPTNWNIAEWKDVVDDGYISFLPEVPTPEAIHLEVCGKNILGSPLAKTVKVPYSSQIPAKLRRPGVVSSIDDAERRTKPRPRLSRIDTEGELPLMEGSKALQEVVNTVPPPRQSPDPGSGD